MHDYEYYEAHAKDIKLEDITSDDYNADILAKIRDDDPELKCFVIDTERDDDNCNFVVREGDHMGWLGYFVGRSQKLKVLLVGSFPENIKLNAFFEGLGHNRSIQNLHIWADLGENFQSLVPFLRNNDSLRHLYFTALHTGLQNARSIALLLSQQSSMTRLYFEDIDFDDEELSQISTALRSQPQIEELSLSSYNVGRNGLVTLGKALEGCLSLRTLDFAAFRNHDIDYEGINALLEGLKHCHNLTSLKLYGVQMNTEEASRSLSTIFQHNCRLENLVLDDMHIDDDGMAVLATGLTCLSSLKRLTLRENSIGDRGLQDLVGGLVNCNLEHLCLSNNMLMDSVLGIKSLGTLCRRTTSMRSLDLRDSSLTDEGIQSFVEGMESCCSLTKLSLSHNISITANGLASLSPLFQAEACTLSDLSLYGIRLGDDGAEVLANGLIGNKSLTALEVSATDSIITASGIRTRGWAAFSRLLCDTSSVNNTYLSNHTLVEVGGFQTSDTPQDIVDFLELNKSMKHAAAICKILRSHPDIDVTPLFEFNLMCLPLVVAWFEKAKSYVDKVNVSTDVFKNRQLSAVYKFVRDMPQLAANGYRSQKEKDVQLQLEVKSKKRKLDQTVR